MKNLFFIPIILIIQISFCFSQKQNNYSISFSGQYGYVFPTDKFLDGTYTGSPTDRFYAYNLRFINQTNGSKDWHKLYKYPSYGFGVYYADFYSPKHLGKPFAIYGFISKTLFNIGKFSLKNDLSLGLSYFPKHWGVDNLENVSIGSHINCYVEEGLTINYTFSNKLETSFGILVSHFSNGATQRPNWAIYTIQPRLSIRYNFYDTQDVYKQSSTIFRKGYEFLTWAYWGYYSEFKEKGIYDFTDKRRYIYKYYNCFGLSSMIYKRLSYKSNLGIGLNFGYDDKADTEFILEGDRDLSTNSPFKDRLNLNAFIGYEYKIQDFSVLFDLGYYLYRIRSNTSSPNFFQRLGFRYHFNDYLFGSVSIRASKFRVAHFIEWGLGYRIKWLKKGEKLIEIYRQNIF